MQIKQMINIRCQDLFSQKNNGKIFLIMSSATILLSALKVKYYFFFMQLITFSYFALIFNVKIKKRLFNCYWIIIHS